MPPVLQSITSTPCSCSVRASAMLSSIVQPVSSTADTRRKSGLCSGQWRRTPRATSTTKRMRFSSEPPYCVGAPVGGCREELVDEIAVRAVYLQHIEACFFGAARALRPASTSSAMSACVISRGDL